MLNREQRRAYQKRIKKNPAASTCPECGTLTLFYTRPALDYTDPLHPVDSKNHTWVCCTCCERVIREGPEVDKLVPPGITLPLPLDAFDKALLYEASRIEEEETQDDDCGVPDGDATAH